MAKGRSNKTAAIADIAVEGAPEEMAFDSLEHRKRMFASQNQMMGNMKLLIACCSVGMIFIAYFIYIYGFHEEQMYEMRTLKDQLPLFFDRYTDIALAYGYLRERIVNNNSLSSFNLTVKHFTEGLDVDGIF